MIVMKIFAGLGGEFFKSRNPEAIKEWYSEYLNMESCEHGKL